MLGNTSPGHSFFHVYQEGRGAFEVDQIMGGDIDDKETFLYGPADLALDSNGNLFVLDRKGHCIKKFDPDGALLRTFSRSGEGPGEMDQALKIAVDSDDNIVIYDASLRRISFFDNNGEFLRSFHLKELGSRFIRDFQVHPNGDIYVEFTESDHRHPQNPSLISICRLRLEPYEEATVDFATIKTMEVLPLKGGHVYFGAPFPDGLYWGITPQGNVVIANSAKYVIKTYSPDLKLICEQSFDRPRKRISDGDKKEYFVTYDASPDIERLRSKVSFPKFKPYFNSLFIDDEGFLLLRTEEPDEDSDIYDVFHPDGGFLGEVTLPHLRRSAQMRDGFIYNIELHEEQDWAVYRYALVQ